MAETEKLKNLLKSEATKEAVRKLFKALISDEGDLQKAEIIVCAVLNQGGIEGVYALLKKLFVKTSNAVSVWPASDETPERCCVNQKITLQQLDKLLLISEQSISPTHLYTAAHIEYTIDIRFSESRQLDCTESLIFKGVPQDEHDQIEVLLHKITFRDEQDGDSSNISLLSQQALLLPPIAALQRMANTTNTLRPYQREFCEECA